MGMYTAFWGKIKIKPEFARVFKAISEDNDWGPLFRHRAIRRHPDMLEVKRRSNNRALFWGVSAYFKGEEFFDDFIDLPEINNEHGRHFDPRTRELSFIADLKNYGDDIECFVRILPVIAEDWAVFWIYEEAKEIPDNCEDTLPRPKFSVSPGGFWFLTDDNMASYRFLHSPIVTVDGFSGAKTRTDPFTGLDITNQPRGMTTCLQFLDDSPYTEGLAT